MNPKWTALLALACCGSASATQMTAADQAVFAKATAEACLGVQARVEANNNLTIGQLQDFCTCYGQKFAEYLPVEQIDKNKDGLTPEVSAKADAFTQTCAVSALKK
jgi:hypothetical protein